MRRAKIGAKTMHRDLNSQTGAESNSHCFVDESLKSLSTSAVVTSSNLHIASGQEAVKLKSPALGRLS